MAEVQVSSSSKKTGADASKHPKVLKTAAWILARLELVVMKLEEMQNGSVPEIGELRQEVAGFVVDVTSGWRAILNRCLRPGKALREMVAEISIQLLMEFGMDYDASKDLMQRSIHNEKKNHDDLKTCVEEAWAIWQGLSPDEHQKLTPSIVKGLHAFEQTMTQEVELENRLASEVEKTKTCIIERLPIVFNVADKENDVLRCNIYGMILGFFNKVEIHSKSLDNSLFNLKVDDTNPKLLSPVSSWFVKLLCEIAGYHRVSRSMKLGHVLPKDSTLTRFIFAAVLQEYFAGKPQMMHALLPTKRRRILAKESSMISKAYEVATYHMDRFQKLSSYPGQDISIGTVSNSPPLSILNFNEEEVPGKRLANAETGEPHHHESNPSSKAKLSISPGQLQLQRKAAFISPGKLELQRKAAFKSPTRTLAVPSDELFPDVSSVITKRHDMNNSPKADSTFQVALKRETLVSELKTLFMSGVELHQSNQVRRPSRPAFNKPAQASGGNN